MVNGISIFREHFSNFKDQYTVIGGFACDLLMNDRVVFTSTEECGFAARYTSYAATYR